MSGNDGGVAADCKSVPFVVTLVVRIHPHAPVLFGDSLMVERRVLAPTVWVRVLVPDPTNGRAQGAS